MVEITEITYDISVQREVEHQSVGKQKDGAQGPPTQLWSSPAEERRDWNAIQQEVMKN